MMARWSLSPFETLAAVSLTVLAYTTLAGCTKGGLKLLPVSGTVTLDGQPVPDAAVLFIPVQGGPPASATTDAQGRFQLATNNQPGAVPGEHRVTITKQTMHGVTADGRPGPGGIRIEWHVPEQYSRAETSGLTATVGPNNQEFHFQLSSMKTKR